MPNIAEHDTKNLLKSDLKWKILGVGPISTPLYLENSRSWTQSN